jgi:hypothetical protein
MLPPGLVAQPADRADHHLLRKLHPAAQTVVRLVVGACSCDLVRARHADPREDERHHRDRYRHAGGPRASLLAAIERHRLGASVTPPSGGWPRALAAFVAEHARNAGETLYLLRFSAPHVPPPADRPLRRIRAAAVVERPDTWLDEHAPVLVAP